jgi:tripartite ATP-independent transporter DctM subunit
MTEVWSLILFALILVFILLGFPVAFTLGGLSLIFGLIFLEPTFFQFMPGRIMGVMTNYVLIAVPLFIFMGIMLEQSGLAGRLLRTMALLAGRKNGGLALAVILVGAMLAASTGIVGATVVTMGLISLPVMLRAGYPIPLATGAIAASGTLGQIIPPSIVLVLLGSVLNVSVGKLFLAAIVPGVLLVMIYMVYVYIRCNTSWLGRPIAIGSGGVVGEAEGPVPGRGELLRTFLLPLLLVALVLGSIFAGIASPTEAAGIGAAGALILAIVEGRLSLRILQRTLRDTMHLSSMVFFILLGASTFALVFRGMGGDHFLIELIRQSQLGPTQFLVLTMLLLFVVGFFIDFIEIIFIVVPIVAPIFAFYGIDLIWIGILIAINLQTSFLTPPFGFALFYLKGVAPAEVRTNDIYKGVLPFIVLQLLVLLLVYFFPGMLLHK